MRTETISAGDELVIRRLVLEPGGSTGWHVDRCRRFTVVVRGEQIAIEYRDTGERILVDVHPGLADWEEPTARVHRAVNTGRSPYEEVVTFLVDAPGREPQPKVR